MKTILKEIPEFKNEEEERAFWEHHDSSEYVDWEQGTEAKLPKLKPTTRSISVRLPQSLIDDLKILANKREALENVLIPFSIEENIKLLKKVGFVSVETYFQWFNFSSFIAVKK